MMFLGIKKPEPAKRPEYKGRLRVEAGSKPCLSLKIKTKTRVVDEARRFVSDWGAGNTGKEEST